MGIWEIFLNDLNPFLERFKIWLKDLIWDLPITVTKKRTLKRKNATGINSEELFQICDFQRTLYSVTDTARSLGLNTDETGKSAAHKPRCFAA